eukprot:1159590-Pelagomonas_calceolata.AAC.2
MELANPRHVLPLFLAQGSVFFLAPRVHPQVQPFSARARTFCKAYKRHRHKDNNFLDTNSAPQGLLLQQDQIQP